MIWKPQMNIQIDPHKALKKMKIFFWTPHKKISHQKDIWNTRKELQWKTHITNWTMTKNNSFWLKLEKKFDWFSRKNIKTLANRKKMNHKITHFWQKKIQTWLDTMKTLKKAYTAKYQDARKRKKNF